MNNSGKEDDDDVLIVGEIKRPENSSKKRSANLGELLEPVRKAKVFILNTQAIANVLDEEKNAKKIAEVSAVATKQESSIHQVVTNQEKSESQQEPIAQEISSIGTPQKASDGSTDAEKTLTLDPPPRMPLCSTAFSLNFVRKSRKNFDKMNRNDLEELLIQKCVEAIVHKSDDADIRNRIETQEKKLQLYRTKYQELRKQYRHLEMVHRRVVEDMKTKNHSVVTPVKITRSVGLQVCISRKQAAVPKPLAPVPTTLPITAQCDANMNRNHRKLPPQRQNVNLQPQQEQQQIRRHQQQEQTQNNLLKQQLMQNNSRSFKPQANVGNPDSQQFSALSRNQNSSPKTHGSAKRPLIPKIILEEIEMKGRMISVTSPSSNSTTPNHYSNQSILANSTIVVRSSVNATVTTTTISNLIDLTDE